MFNLRENKKGFTLIELIVVMAIIGILVLLATPKFLNYIKDANVTALQADVKVLGDAGMYHYIRHDNAYPVELDSSGSPEEVDLEGLSLADGQTAEDKKAYDKVLEGYYYETLGVTKEEIDSDKGLGGKYEGLDWATVSENLRFSKFDQQEMSEHIRNTRSPMKDFFLITDGPLIGEVVYNRVLENSIGEKFISLIGIDIDLTE